MTKLLVTDELWAVIEPLLPKEPPKPKGGRPRVPDRAALTGILFVLEMGIPPEMLLQENLYPRSDTNRAIWGLHRVGQLP